jgi:hypothetical protein
MASIIRSELTTPARVPFGHGDRVEQEAHGEPQTRSGCLQLLDAELEQVTAAGGGVHVGSDGANN